MKLDPNIIEQFWKDGAICLRHAFDSTWIERLRQAVDQDIAHHGPLSKNRTSSASPGLFFVDFQLWQRFDACLDFVWNSAASQLIAQVLKTEKVYYYHDHLLVKEPGATDPTPWHHDQPYYPLEGHQISS